MRACFLGQNICSLGFGIATLQAPPLVMDTPVQPSDRQTVKSGPDQESGRDSWPDLPTVFAAVPVTIPQRPVP